MRQCWRQRSVWGTPASHEDTQHWSAWLQPRIRGLAPKHLGCRRPGSAESWCSIWSLWNRRGVLAVTYLVSYKSSLAHIQKGVGVFQIRFHSIFTIGIGGEKIKWCGCWPISRHHGDVMPSSSCTLNIPNLVLQNRADLAHHHLQTSHT